MEARETAQNLFRTSGEPTRGGVARAAGRVDSNLNPVSVAYTNRSSILGSESISVACLLGAPQLERLLEMRTDGEIPVAERRSTFRKITIVYSINM